MTITDIRVYDNSGLLWSLGDTPFVSFGSFGQYIRIETDATTTNAITGNLTFDASMFSDNAFDSGGEHPNAGKEARGFILDVTSLAISTPTTMLEYGNNKTHNIGEATLEITDVSKKAFTITHEFNLLKDTNSWMHSQDESVQDNSDALTNYGDSTSVYEVIKYYNVYIWFIDENDSNGAALSFSKKDEYNNGSGIVSDISFEYYDGVTQRDGLLSNADTTVRVLFDDFDSLVSRVDLVLGSSNIQAELNEGRDSQLGLLSYTTTTITTVSGTEKYAEFLVSQSDLQYKNYDLIATIKNAANLSTSSSDTKAVKMSYTECVPAIDVNWKSYLNTRATSKIDCAGYERMCLELTIWHDEDPLLSPSYETCLGSQDIFNNTLLGSLKGVRIPILDEVHIFTNDNGTITSNYTEDEIENGSSGGFDFTKLRVFFRVEENYIGQLETFDATLYSEFIQIVDVNGTLTPVVVVGHTVNQPLEIRCAIYENDNGTPDITALNIFDSNGVQYNAICEDSEYIECVAESAIAYDVQALLVKPSLIEEEELFNSIQSETFFDTYTSNYIYDLEGNFSTGGDCSFKIDNINLSYQKIMVVCCK